MKLINSFLLSLLIQLSTQLSAQEYINQISSDNKEFNCDSVYNRKDTIAEMGFIFETALEIVGGFDTIAHLLSYPMEFKTFRVSGLVLADIMISKSGSLKCYKIWSGLPYPFLEEAERVVKLLDFTPATIRGRGIQSEMVIPIRFVDPNSISMSKTKKEKRKHNR